MHSIKHILLFLFVSFTLSASSQKEVKALDKYFEQAIQDWNIPGMGVVIYKDGKVVLSKGYGVKNVDTQEKVDANTLFAIASNTKAFTTAALAILVDEGKLKWDDKVVDYLPYFELYDSYVTANFTVRDLVCHRSGLATFSGDLLWYGSKYSREEIIEKAKYLEPAAGFREAYGYQNIMFMAAGEVVAEVSGISWDEFVKTHFFGPLNMSNTLTSISDINNKTNIALPHNNVDGTNKVIDWVNWDNMAPAGSILSSPNDLGKWLELQLNQGIYKNDTIFSTARSNEMWTINTPKTISNWKRKNYPGFDLNGYGLGWDIFMYNGQKVVNHGGGYDGMISQTVLVPEENMGAVFVTNNNNWLPGGLMYQFLDVMNGDKDADWSKFYLDLKIMVDGFDDEAEQRKLDARKLNTKPSLALKEYAGTYSGEMYGDCIVTVEGDHLKFEFEPTPLFKGTLTHWHYDTFELSWSTQMMLPKGTAHFILDTSGNVEEMKIDVPNPDFDFGELEFKKIK